MNDEDKSMNIFSKFEDLLPEEVFEELQNSLRSYREGRYKDSFRSVAFVAEWLTGRWFLKDIVDSETRKIETWNDRLNILYSNLERGSKEAKEPILTPVESVIHVLHAIRIIRNKIDHPQEHPDDIEFAIDGDVSMMGILNIYFCIQILVNVSILD